MDIFHYTGSSHPPNRNMLTTSSNSIFKELGVNYVFGNWEKTINVLPLKGLGTKKSSEYQILTGSHSQ